MELNIDKTGWKKVRFGEVCRQVNETARNPQEEGLIHVVGLEHIGSNDLHIRSWNTLERETTFTRKFVKGQVLFGRRRAYQAKVAYAEFDGICSGDILVFEAIKNKLLPELLPFMVQSQKFYNKAVETSAGSLSPRTKFKDLADLEFLLPPKEQQARLAELLWAADEVVEREKEVFNTLHTYHKSFLKEKFQDINEPLIKFSDLVKVNPSVNRNDNQEQLGSFISMSDVSNDGRLIGKEDKTIKELQGNGYTPFVENDILFAKITPCMENGKGAIAKGLANGVGFGSTEFHILKPKQKSDLMFCFYLTKMDLFRQKAEKLMTGSAGQKRVQSDFFDYFKFSAPNKIERKIIGTKLEEIQENVAKVNTCIANASLFKQRLVNEIF
jgi:type I restriction enzyme S subunit